MHNGTKVPHLGTQYAKKKKQLINPTGLHRGFERDGESSTARVEDSSLSLQSDEEPALAAAVSNLAILLQRLTKGRISRVLSVPFPSALITLPPLESHRRCYAHQAKTNRCNTSPKIIHLQGLLFHTFVQMCERSRTERLRAECYNCKLVYVFYPRGFQHHEKLHF